MEKHIEKLIKDEIGRLQDEIYRRKSSGMYMNDLKYLEDKKAELEKELSR